MSRTRSIRHTGLLASLALALVVVPLAPSPALAPVLAQKLLAPDGAASHRFGGAVAVDGSTLVIGSPGSDGSRGAVHVFERSAENWARVSTLTASDAAPYDQLGSSVAIEGDTIVAGATGVDVGGVNEQGAVYTFARTGSAARTETAKLIASDGATSDQLGWSVAVAGETVVAGAPRDDDAAKIDEGSVYTFARSGAAVRTETAKLTASDGASNDSLGESVAIEGETLVAGAPNDSFGTNYGQGSVYIFATTGPDARTETANLTASDGAAYDHLGISVAIAGGTVAAGAYGDAVDTDAMAGSVYAFASTGSAARNETAKLTASDGEAYDFLGISVAMTGDLIVAGAYGDDVGSNAGQGSVYTFARTGPTAWSAPTNVTDADGAEEDRFGWAVSVAPEAIVAGAPYDNVGVNADQGSASVFLLPVPVPTPGPAPDNTAPDTTGLKGPKKVVKGKVAKFRFSSSEPGSTFRCKVDKKRWKDCTAPYKVKTSKLKVGKHKLRVVAVDAAGNVDPSPAKKTFRVLPR